MARSWGLRYRRRNGFLILDSAPAGMPELCVVDVDDPKWIPWVTETFGDTPLKVTTGREGGGVHLYYRLRPGASAPSRNGQLGPPEAWEVRGKASHPRTKIDFKAGRSYVVAPGSRHKSGMIYRASAPITRELILSLPEIDLELVAAELGKNRPLPSPLAGEGRRRAKKPPETAAAVSPCLPPLDVIDEPAANAAPKVKIGKFKITGLRPETKYSLKVDFATTRVGSGPFKGRTLIDCPKGTRIPCPFHEGSNPTPGVVLEQGKLFYCHTCTTSYCHAPGPALFLIEKKEGRAVPPLDLSLDAWTHLDPARIPGGSVALRSPKGSGKTYWVGEEVARLHEETGHTDVVVAVTHSVALSAVLSGSLNLPNYQDFVEDGRKLPLSGSVVVCINSVRRYPYETRGPDGAFHDTRIDLLFIDEIESVSDAFHSGTMDGDESRTAWKWLVWAIRTARRLIVAYADLSTETMQWLEAVRPHDPPRLVDVYQSNPYTYKTSSDSQLVEAKLRQRWGSDQEGDRVAVACGSKAKAKQIAKTLEKLRPAAKVLLLTQETVNDHEIASINDWIGDYDAIVYTNTIGTGISIDIRGHFLAIFGFFVDQTITATACMQMLHRVRHPILQDVFIHTKSGRTPLPTDYEEIEGRYRAREAMTRSEARRLGIFGDFQYAPEPDHGDAEFLRFLAVRTARRNALGIGNIEKGIADYISVLPLSDNPPRKLEEVEHPLADDERAEIRALTARAKAEVKEDDFNDLLTAPQMDYEKAKEIEVPADRSEALSVEKAKAVHFWGRPFTEAVFERDNAGRGRKTAATFARLRLMHEGNDLLLLDMKEQSEGTCAAFLRNDWLQFKALWKVLNRATIFDVPLGSPIPPEKAQAAVKFARANKKELWDLAGLAVPGNAEANPYQFLENLLRRAGLKFKCVRRRVKVEIDGVVTMDRIREYSLDVAAFKAALDWAEPEYLRLLEWVDRAKTAEINLNEAVKHPPGCTGHRKIRVVASRAKLAMMAAEQLKRARDKRGKAA